jgi:hypothetical protein
MPDNKSRGRSTDRKRLNMSEPYEVKYAKSDRASPQRKSLLAGGEAARGARSAKKAGGSGGAKTGRGSAKSGSAGRGSASGGARKSASAGARKSSSGGARKTASGSARKSSSGGARKSSGGARKSASASGRRSSGSNGRKSASARASASPAMKRTNAAPAKRPAQATRGTPHPPKEEKTIENTAPKTMREGDAVDLLTDDHLAVSALFKRYEKLADREAGADERRALAQQICEMLKAHTQIEEEIFYPAARKAGIDADLLDEAKVEHQSAKDLIAQIEAGNPDDDLYDAKVTVLREYVQHHVVEEQTEMFPKCRREGMDLVALRSELEARKMSILPGDAAMAEDAGAKEEPGLLAKLSGKLFSSEDKQESESAPRG